MNPRTRRSKPFLIDRTQGLALTLIHRRLYIVLIVPLLAVGLAITYLPTGTSHAATTAITAPPGDDGLAWNPGSLTQYNNGSGYCTVDVAGVVSSSDATGEAALIAALNQMPSEDVDIDGTDVYHFDGPTASSGTQDTLTGHSDLDCGLVNQVGFLFEARHPGTEPALFQLPSAGFHNGAPQWLKGALAILTTTVVFIAVSAAVIATMTALGLAAAPTGGMSAAALGLLAGCIGGAAGDAVGLAIAGADTSPLSVLGEVVAGCVTGAALEAIPVHSAGQWLATEIRGLFGAGAAAVGGTALTDAAASAGVSLSPIQQAMQNAISGLDTL